MKHGLPALLALVLVGVSTPTFGGEPERQLLVERSFSQSWPSGQVAELEIKIARGKVRVVGSAHREVRLRAQLGRELEGVEVRRAERWWAIEVLAPSSQNSEAELASELEIEVPWDSIVDVAAPAADVAIEGVRGPVTLRTLDGKLSVVGAPAELFAQSTSGAVQLDVNCPRVNVKNVAGAVRVAGMVEDLRAEMVDGDLRVEATIVHEAHLVSAQGLVELSGEIGELARVRIETLGGTIRLRQRANLEGHFQVTSFEGELLNANGPTFPRKGLRRELAWRVGPPGAGASPRRIVLGTFSGRIEFFER